MNEDKNQQVESAENKEEYGKYKKVWDEYCKTGYDHFHKMKVAQEIVGELSEALLPCPGGVVLDGGCGTGMLFRKILEKTQANKLIGADLSEKMLEGAKKKLSGRLKDVSEKIELVNTDLNEKFPFPDNNFDAEVFSLSINYIPQGGWKRALKEAFRTTKSGGYVYVACQNSDFDFSEGYKKEVLKEIKEKFFRGQFSFILWMFKLKTVFINKINQWTKDNFIKYPGSEELLEYHKKIGFNNVEIISKPYYETCVVTRARKP